jgi:hypothetical protein
MFWGVNSGENRVIDYSIFVPRNEEKTNRQETESREPRTGLIDDGPWTIDEGDGSVLAEGNSRDQNMACNNALMR